MTGVTWSGARGAGCASDSLGEPGEPTEGRRAGGGARRALEAAAGPRREAGPARQPGTGAAEAAGSGGRGLGLAALPLSDGEMPAGGVKCPAP